MKNIFLEEQPNLNKTIIGLTFILFFCAVTMRLFGIYSKFNLSASFTLGLFCFLYFFMKKEVNKDKDKSYDSYNIFLATLFVSDMMYVLSLFFLLGRTFIKYL